MTVPQEGSGVVPQGEIKGTSGSRETSAGRRAFVLKAAWPVETPWAAAGGAASPAGIWSSGLELGRNLNGRKAPSRQPLGLGQSCKGEQGQAAPRIWVK